MNAASPKTVREALLQTQSLGLERLDAQMLLLLALEQDPHDRSWLLRHDQDPLAPAAAAILSKLVQRRLGGEPMAYIQGEKSFFGLRLQVDARVLVPRPDTETLVEWALEALGTFSVEQPRLVDLGTGSGAIGLAVKSIQPHRSRRPTPAQTRWRWRKPTPDTWAWPSPSSTVHGWGPSQVSVFT